MLDLEYFFALSWPVGGRRAWPVGGRDARPRLTPRYCPLADYFGLVRRREKSASFSDNEMQGDLLQQPLKIDLPIEQNQNQEAQPGISQPPAIQNRQ